MRRNVNKRSLRKTRGYDFRYRHIKVPNRKRLIAKFPLSVRKKLKYHLKKKLKLGVVKRHGLFRRRLRKIYGYAADIGYIATAASRIPDNPFKAVEVVNQLSRYKVCRSRKERRIALFRKDIAGKGKKINSPKRKKLTSKIKC